VNEGGRTKKATVTWLALFAAISLLGGAAVAGEFGPVKLPEPQTDGGKPLMQALKLRATSREFSPDPLPDQTLSNLLWAAWGINRPADGKRTAPSARNFQEIDVIVVRADGAYLYDAASNALKPLAAGDHRPLTGTQPFVKDAPVTLVYVADRTRVKAGSAPSDDSWSWADAGFVSQNVYLFCASEGLATGVRALIDRPALAKALGLGEGKLILMAQCVGYPKSRK
jgi:nitroreductase